MEHKQRVLALGAVQLAQVRPYGQLPERQPPYGVPVAQRGRAPGLPCLMQGPAPRPQAEQQRAHPGEGWAI